MALVMLRRNWPGNFRRTVNINEKKYVLEFTPGEPQDLNAQEIEALKPDFGAALLPVEIDQKGKIRVISDEVVADDSEAPQSTEDPTATDEPKDPPSKKKAKQ